jgi:hypothetical protein
MGFAFPVQCGSESNSCLVWLLVAGRCNGARPLFMKKGEFPTSDIGSRLHFLFDPVAHMTFGFGCDVRRVPFPEPSQSINPKAP